MNDVRWLNLLKAKFSIGVQGNDNLGRDDDDDAYRVWAYRPYQDVYRDSNSGDSNNPFALSFIRKGNKDITWESSTSINAGIDFEVLDSRIVGSVEFFKRKISDMLYNQPVPVSKGYTSFPNNVGDMENTGFEFDLTGYILRFNGLEWSVNINGTHYKNEITDLDAAVRENGIKNANTIYRIGGSVYNVYMVRTAGVDHSNGEPLFYSDPDAGDFSTVNDWSKAEKSDLGSPLPKIYGGFGTTLTWKGLDFTAQFSYQLGGKVYDGTYEALMHSGNSSNSGTNWHKDILGAWTPENPDSDIPRLCTGDNRYQNTQDRFLVKSNYLSFNSAVLGYTFKKDLTRKFFVENMRVYVSADNIALHSYRKGLDPRQRLEAGGSTTSGNFSYSALRNVSGGIQITF